MPPAAPSSGGIDGAAPSEAARQRTLVLAKPEGQLGNRLFLAATLLAHAAEHNLRLLNPSLGEYAEFFQGTCGSLIPRFPSPANSPSRGWIPFSKSLRRLLAVSCDCMARALGKIVSPGAPLSVLDICETHDRDDRDYELSAVEFANLCRGPGMLILRGWKFRANEALERNHALIKETFRPVADIQKQVSDAIAAAREKTGRLIGVHVRQGDYRHWLGGKYFFQQGNYLEWMRQTAALWPGQKVGFLVCTNAEWQALKVGDCPIYRGPGSPAADLYALATCDAIMGPPSSFSLWASYYGQVPLHMLESIDQQVHPVTFTMHRKI